MAAERDDDWAQKGMDHLQAAAREVIQATRTFLDAAEELVEDPKAVEGLMTTLGTFAAAAASRLRSESPPSSEDDGDDGDDGRVQPIRVS